MSTFEHVEECKAQLARSQAAHTASLNAVRDAERRLDAESSKAAEQAVVEAENAARLAKVRCESDQRKLTVAERSFAEATRATDEAKLVELQHKLDTFDDGGVLAEQIALLTRFVESQTGRQAKASQRLSLITELRSVQMRLGLEPVSIDPHDLRGVPPFHPISEALSQLRPTSNAAGLTLIALCNLKLDSFAPQPRKDL